LLPALVLS
jgi:hypothetical protein